MLDREYNWKDDSQCSKDYNLKYRDHFFSEDPVDIATAKDICFSCPVREQCLRSALDSKEVWGVWGGCDETQIRNTLSVNEEVQEVRRLRDGISPTCLYCNAETEHLSIKELDVPGGGRWTTKKVITCNKCDFYWTSRTSANAIEAYMATKYRSR